MPLEKEQDALETVRLLANRMQVTSNVTFLHLYDGPARETPEHSFNPNQQEVELQVTVGDIAYKIRTQWSFTFAQEQCSIKVWHNEKMIGIDGSSATVGMYIDFAKQLPYNTPEVLAMYLWLVLRGCYPASQSDMGRGHAEFCSKCPNQLKCLTGDLRR